MLLIRLFLTLFLSTFFYTTVLSQSGRFIYLQSQNNIPFYVKINNKYLSSSNQGYIIIPKLKDSIYVLLLGSPVKQWPEQEFTISTISSNAGYLIKENKSNNVNIITLQNMIFRTTVLLAKDGIKEESVQKNDEFARVLAQVVNDPSIAQIQVESPLSRISTVTQDLQKETLIVNTNHLVEPNTTSTTQISSEIQKEDIGNTGTILSSNKKAKIVKLYSENTNDELKTIYFDTIDADTIEIIIPTNQPNQKNNSAFGENTQIAQSPDTSQSLRFLDMQLKNPNQNNSEKSKQDDYVIIQKKIEDDTISSPINKMVNNDSVKLYNKPVCKIKATQKDFLNLRKKMAVQINEDDMFKVASKQLVKTCFTTEQIKNLSVLFISEQKRYEFYVTAFSYVSDSENYLILKEQLKDTYYKTRLQAMLNSKLNNLQ